VDRLVDFGIQLWQENFDFNSLKEACLKIEEMNFRSIWLYDHFYPLLRTGSCSILEAYVTLSALTALTKRIRLGVLVTCNSFRCPSLLAKMAASIDVMGGGRLEFGIGAGWFEEESVAYGIPFPKSSIRIERLQECVQIVKEMWTRDRADFQGKHYRIRAAICEPKPNQKPHPPIWIGGSGEKRTLKVVAQFANYSNFASVSPDECVHKMKVLKRHCQALGRDFDDLKKSWHGVVLMGDNKEELRRLAKERQANNVNSAVKAMDFRKYLDKMILGTADECVEKIHKYIEAGITYFILAFPGGGTVVNSANEFCKKVIRSVP